MQIVQELAEGWRLEAWSRWQQIRREGEGKAKGVGLGQLR
jgi:hypothetical protein